MPVSIGKTLKSLRESKGISVESVSEKTHIPKKIISAIEEDRLNEISSDFYARRFVKSYSQFLGGLEEKTVKEYLSELQKKDEPIIVLKKGDTLNARVMKYKRHIAIVVLVVLAIWALFLGFIEMKKFARRTKARYMDSKTKAVDKIDKKVSTKRIEGPEIAIKARTNTWIQVVADGKLLFKGILKKKEKDIWRAKKEIRLELGSAGGVTLTVNEKDIGSLGKKGEKKSLVITGEGIVQ